MRAEATAAMLICALTACSAPSSMPAPSAAPATQTAATASQPAVAVTQPAKTDCAKASARDFDGDGHDDIAIGYTGRVGRVHVLSADKVITIPEPPGNRAVDFGRSVTMAKVNDDDCIDVIVGAPGGTVAGKTGSGAVYILYGGAAAPPRRLVSLRPEEDANFGESVAAHGDLIAIGAPNERPGGAVYLAEKGSISRRITQETRGVPGTSEPDDHFGEHLALGPLARGGVGLMAGAPNEHQDGPGRQDSDGLDEPPGAVTVLHDVTAANLTGVRLPPPTDKNGKPCGSFGENLAYVPHAGPAALSADCGLLQFYDLDLNLTRTVAAPGPSWAGALSASGDGQVAALWNDDNDPALLLLSPKDPAKDRRISGDHLRYAIEGGITFSGTRLVVGLDWTADLAIIDLATERAELVKAATGQLSVGSIAG
ncbi:VCBS repeat-containing protein [Nonomuraea sp. NPDC048892]|uniref:VCBS repeat-containing protein n=1 Tax=Nonomuraea sp. NPDC048892 TaxID=3154624 RepID=UPI00340415FD